MSKTPTMLPKRLRVCSGLGSELVAFNPVVIMQKKQAVLGA